MGSADDQWGGDPKDAARHIVATTGILAKSDEGIDHGWAALTKQRPCVSKSDSAAVAAENPRTQLAFKQIDPPAEGRGRGFRASCSSTKRSQLGYGEERLEQRGVDELGLS
jgi:hypothetical protein